MAMSLPWLGPLAVFVLTTAVVRVVLGELQRRRLLDHPNERSSHAVPTPRGGGIGILLVLLPALAVHGYLADYGAKAALAALLALGLGAVSWIDDRRRLQALPRLAAHLAVACIGCLMLEGPVLPASIPFWLERTLIVIAWVWFINLYNFMDGIDGITGAETMAIGAGLFALAAIAGSGVGDGVPALMLAAAAAGFLVWNWHPARVFMGDVGSVPLGFLAGWLLLDAAARGAFMPAIILPLYYCADATLVLIRRLLRGERVWQAHRQHWYQRAIQHGRTPPHVVAAVSGANAILILLALWATAQPLPALAAAAVVVAGLLHYLGRPRART
ncbi:MAG: glycosyltransferase family 4 protein [Alphaproteobacteria bacterium]|nr:glycosyltransferase family 4 protein [Alphaproteobacteria bacterium]